MKAYELLATPDKWTQGTYARDKNGDPTSCKEGECFCVLGAIFRCYPELNASDKAMFRVLQVIGPRYSKIPKWNDDPSRTHAEVLAVLKQADV